MNNYSSNLDFFLCWPVIPLYEYDSPFSEKGVLSFIRVRTTSFIALAGRPQLPKTKAMICFWHSYIFLHLF